MSHREAAIVPVISVSHSIMDHDPVSDRSGFPSPSYLAHVRRNDDGSFAIHHLDEHLRADINRPRLGSESSLR